MKVKIKIAGLLVCSTLLAETTQTEPLSVRNNNPGNIKHYKSNSWIGSAYENERRFEVFYNRRYGMRALDIVLLKNIRRTDSVHDFVERYALEGHEDMDVEHAKSYAKDIIKALGYSGKIQEKDILKLRKVVIKREGGQQAVEYFVRKYKLN